MACMLCIRKGEKTFNINFFCGDAKNTIKDDIMELLGSAIESHLKPDDVVCNICMNMLDDIAKIKRKLLEIVVSPRGSVYPIKLGKSWDFFAKIARNQFEESDFDEPITPSSLTPLSVVPSPNRSTPSQFWSISHCKEYNHELEERCARREMAKRKRSQSKSSIRSSSSYGNDEEVAKLFKGKKRRGRRPRSAGGLPKIITKRLRRVQSENERSNSSLSDQSCMSFTRIKKDFRPRTPKLIYGEDKELIRPRTRSISRMVFYCSDCFEDKKDLDMYTAHMIEVHNRKACYRCSDCGVFYVTEDHLTMHQKIHKNQTLCTICGAMQGSFEILRNHTDRHFQYSVPCSYCDLSFLSRYDCNYHVFNYHRSKSKRQKVMSLKEDLVEKIVTYTNNVNLESNNKEPWNSNYSTKKFDILPMILNIERRPEFQRKSFKEIDYKLRHPEPVTIPKEITSLGDDVAITEENRFLYPSSSISLIISSDSDSDAPLSDSSIYESVRPRKRIKSSRTHKREISTDVKNLSPLSISPSSKLDNSIDDLQISNVNSVEDRLPSPVYESIRSVDLSDSEHSDSIQTEMHYVDGNIIHTNVDLADIVNLNSTLGVNESNSHEEGVELDPNIADG